MSENTPCPCGTTLTYTQCCGVFHTGAGSAETAEQLMRSRYTAYSMGLVDYLTRTQHSALEPVEIDAQLNFQRLQILSTSQGGPNDKQGKVEFVAFGLVKNKLVEHREVSRFRRFKGEWIYLDEKG